MFNIDVSRNYFFCKGGRFVNIGANCSFASRPLNKYNMEHSYVMFLVYLVSEIPK